MSDDRLIVVYNRASRRGKSATARVRERVEASAPLRERVEWVDLRELDHLETAQRPPARVVAIGGDGTVNAAASWIVAREIDAPIAVIPAGTGNNLARGLGVPLDRMRALDLATDGEHTRPVDAIAVSPDGTRRVLLQSGALGFPAEIAARYDSLRRNALFRGLTRPFGPSIYRMLALLGLRSQKKRERLGRDLLELECRLPDGVLRETVLAVFINNERSLGGNFIPCPAARVDDGALDLCLIRARTGASYLRLFSSIARGEHLAFTDAVVPVQSAGPVTLRFSAPTPLLVDGDICAESDSYTLEVVPARFRFLVP